MLTLPEEHRRLFKEPFGELHHEIEEILPRLAGHMVCAVGDVVTHNLQKNGIVPDVAVVDGYTMRSPCSRMPDVTGSCITVKNPAGTLTSELIAALDQAIASPPTTIVVDGEEDLAVIPMVIAAPIGAIVLYGQPHEGVVFRTVTPEAKETAKKFLKHFTNP
ncbi:GTP-dependent dephospho-CoA kinase family protein [uncultured Methanoregula sp.]|uniref:GTP-dependent dephospho-CoA kinase family protein n=1 Tax=uncultured Methanoregula sp. TaxID=1005933 RepID=UPI002AAC344D|nr:GTP-dependent dephospho-CoA kinase family protein [uncultured Methanoregula sp.]